MQTPNFNHGYPPLTIKILQSSQGDGFPLPILLTRPSTVKPEITSMPTQPIFLTSEQSQANLQTRETPNSPSRIALKRKVEPKSGKGRIVKQTKSQNNLFKTVDRLREIRTASEARIQKNLEEIDFTDQSYKDKFAKDWQTLLKTGRYIGQRGEERMAFRMTGRDFKKEKVFEGIRRTLEEVKHEFKNRGKVIKYMSKNEVDPALLAQPHFTPTDANPVSAQKEQRKTPEPSRFKTDVSIGLSDLQLDPFESPGFIEKELLFSYNKEQLKKLKSSISFIHKVTSKTKLRSSGIPFASREASTDKEKGEDGQEETEETKTEDYSKYYGGSGSASKLLGTDSRKKFYSKKQKVEDRMKSQGPKKELLKKLVGFTPEPETAYDFNPQSTTKTSFFKTISESIPISESPARTEYDSGNGLKAFASYRASANTIEADEIQTSTPFYLPQQFSSFSPTRKPSEEVSSSLARGIRDGNSIYKTGRFIRTGVSTGKLSMVTTMNNKTPQGNISHRSWQIKENPRKGKAGYRIEPANEEIQKKYKLITMECENNIKSGSALQSSLQKGFGLIKGQLNKMGEFIANDSCFIDWQIKQDIYTELQNSRDYNLAKRSKSKPGADHKTH